MSILLFEDNHVADLFPISISRPAFTISCGSYRLIDLVASLGCNVRWLVRPHLREIQQADFEHLSSQESRPREHCLAVNAAVVPSLGNLAELRRLLESKSSGFVRTSDGRIAAASLRADSPLLAADRCEEFVAGVGEENLHPLDTKLSLFHYPHDVIRHHQLIVRESLEHRAATNEYHQRSDGLFIHEAANLGEHVAIDSRQGPIVIDRGASIGPFTLLRGPVYVGPDSRVAEHAAIKDGTCLAHTTKIGGEVEASIVEAYTNKQHHGFLGHSYLASWINLGAGTCNSDLKNTYGQVNMEYCGRKVPTGMQFVGSIIADYAKTAINTGIFTGKTIGTCSMVYGFVTTNVPSFVNYARLFGQVTETPVDVMIATQGRMFARRNVLQRPCDIQLLRDMFELTRNERQIGGDPLSL